MVTNIKNRKKSSLIDKYKFVGKSIYKNIPKIKKDKHTHKNIDVIPKPKNRNTFLDLTIDRSEDVASKESDLAQFSTNLYPEHSHNVNMKGLELQISYNIKKKRKG